MSSFIDFNITTLRSFLYEQKNDISFHRQF
jgi:hypothetical protein